MNAAENALVRAYVACRLALESIDELPRQTAEAVEEPIREFCRRLEPFVDHLEVRTLPQQRDDLEPTA